MRSFVHSQLHCWRVLVSRLETVAFCSVQYSSSKMMLPMWPPFTSKMPLLFCSYECFAISDCSSMILHVSQYMQNHTGLTIMGHKLLVISSCLLQKKFQVYEWWFWLVSEALLTYPSCRLSLQSSVFALPHGLVLFYYYSLSCQRNHDEDASHKHSPAIFSKQIIP